MEVPETAGLLTSAEYQLLAAPALQAAAETAAQRGDPHLYNDLPAMLALLGLATALTRIYLEDPLPDASPQPTLEAAPLAVCALVFTESGLEAPAVQQCLQALSRAYLQLLREGALGPQEALVEKAYVELMQGRRAQALQSLRQAALSMTRAVDAWEAARAGAASAANRAG